MRNRYPKIKLTPKESFANINYDFNYGDYEYLTETNCYEAGCSGICRCSQIVDQKIINVPFDSIVNKVQKHFKVAKAIDLYGIDRILRFFKIYDNDNWYISVSGGYYGQEIDGFHLESCDKLFDTITSFLALPNISKKTEFLLELEYGYLIDKAKDKKWSIKTVDFKLIKTSNEVYVKKVQKEENLYVGYKGICCVCVFEDDLYRVIDGYHRFVANNRDKVKIIYCYK